MTRPSSAAPTCRPGAALCRRRRAQSGPARSLSSTSAYFAARAIPPFGSSRVRSASKTRFSPSVALHVAHSPGRRTLSGACRIERRQPLSPGGGRWGSPVSKEALFLLMNVGTSEIQLAVRDPEINQNARVRRAVPGRAGYAGLVGQVLREPGHHHASPRPLPAGHPGAPRPPAGPCLPLRF